MKGRNNNADKCDYNTAFAMAYIIKHCNKYHIKDAYLFFDEYNQHELEQLSGNNAVIKFAKHLGITPRHLIKLCPEIPDIEEIGVHQIYSLLRLNFNHAILNMMNEDWLLL